MPFKRLILLVLGIFMFCALRGVDWAQAPLEPSARSPFLSLTRLAPSTPSIVENESIKPEVSPLKSLLLFNFGQNNFALKTSVVEKQSGGQRPGNFPDVTGKQNLLQTLATGALLEGSLLTEGELAYGPFDPKSLQGLGDPQRRLLRLALRSGWGNLSYGAEYRIVGKGFTNFAGPQLGSDQEGGEIWTQRKFGVLSLKGALSQFTDNVERNPLSPRITKTRSGATLSLALPSWPLLSLSYSRGFSSSSVEPAGFQPEKGSLETVGASIDYHAPVWDARLASSYELANTRSLSSFSTGSYSISPRAQTQTPLLSLGITYRLIPGAITLATGGSYTGSKSSDGLFNHSALNASTSVVWNLGKSSLGNETFSIEAQQSRHMDAVFPGNSHNDLAVRFMFKIGFM